MSQSSELSGGAGFTFEDAAVAIYLAALLAEGPAPGLPGRVVVRVASQQAAFGEPLDDLIVDGRAVDGDLARLSLQAKRALVISAGRTNNDFRDIVLRARKTIQKQDFRQGIDRVGAVTGTISDASKRVFETVCEWARTSATTQAFMDRFAPEGSASRQHRSVIIAIREILSESEIGIEDVEIHNLLRHFVLLRFDLLHEGSVDEPHAVANLRSCLRSEEASRAHDLWCRLRLIAREGGGHAADFDRPTLLGRLIVSFRFAGAPSLRRDLETIAEEARLSLADIPADVDGYHVARPRFVSEIEERLRDQLFVQINGLPGTGKSAILRELAERRQASGPVLVIKSDRITDPSWPVYAQSLGLVATGLETLLMEITAVGSPIVFIDGLDRIEVPHRGIVLDLVNTILGSSALRTVWRILATVRDSGIEPLRTWLPARLMESGCIASVTVDPFDDDEAALLAKKVPALIPLLFGQDRIKEITRRPFFVAVLAKRAEVGALMPRSEMELVDEWWARGGYRATPTMIARRQRALKQLANAGATTLGRRMSTDNFDLDAIDELKRDGILRDARVGHSVRFAHDIFFEWSFMQLLISRDDGWPDEIRAVGEPPVLGRAVELLSQSVFIGDDGWEEHLTRIEASSMRSQWTRAWLLGPMGAADFLDRAASFAEAAFRDDARRLTKLVVWFQAEKTRPNPLVLANREPIDGLSRWEILQAADAYSVPDDYWTWNRCCAWLLDNIERCPVEVIPEIVSMFEVWQNAMADLSNPTSERILGVVLTWLERLEDCLYPEERGFGHYSSEMARAGVPAEIEERLRALLLRSARVRYDRASDYLARVQGRRRLRDRAFRKILLFSSVLCEKHGSQIVELTLAELKDDLPADVAARRERDSFHTTDSFDWHSLAINHNTHSFFPPSPLREPFASLFKSAPAEARRLVRDLTNHAIMAWRQLFKLDREHHATPIPLILHFLGGTQTFWGDGRVYGWFRGHGAPDAVEAGLMALERWAFAQIEEARDVDEVIRDVVAGHDSVAVLGIAVALALTARRVSRTTLPLAVNQRLWSWDIERSVHDFGFQANLIGFTDQIDHKLADAVREANDLEARRLEIRWLAQLFVLSADDELRNPAQVAIQAFPDNLPFEFEEQKANVEYTTDLRQRAELWSELGRIENYSAIRAEDGERVYVQVNNPRSADAHVIAAAQRLQTMAEHLTVLNWVLDCLKNSSLSDKLVFAEAIDRAKRLDATELFLAPHGDVDSEDNCRSAVAGAAAVALTLCDGLEQSDLEWAKDVAFRAATIPEKRGDAWSSRSVLSHHPCLFAVRGLAACIRKGIVPQDAKRALIQLAGHPLEQISQTAIGAALALWHLDPVFAWAALNLGLELSIGTVQERLGSSALEREQDSRSDRVRRSIQDTLDELGEPNDSPPKSLLPIPDAWVFAPRISFEARRPSAPVWRDPDVFLRWDFLPKVMTHVPVDLVISDALRRPAFLALCDQLVAWTIERLSPSWRQDDEARQRDNRSPELLEWRQHLYMFLARVALCMEVNESHDRFLEPAFTLDDKLAVSLIKPFTDILVCSVMDAPVVRIQTIQLIQTCLDRVLQLEDWNRARLRDGKVYGFDLPGIIPVLFFVQIEHAGGATRFANGDWRDVQRILPIVDPFVRAVGDLPIVTTSFLTLCERAFEHYPPDIFVDQIDVVLAKQPGIPVGWRGSAIPSRIAALVHEFAQRTLPVPTALGQGMLRILDKLVDMGDRRSAALQTSEIFREVAVAK